MLNQTQKNRLGYISMPSDYVRELKREGKREKAQAFMDYYDDMEANRINSFRFYGSAWKIDHKTAKKWIIEFKAEIEIYFAHWMLKNVQHYKSVQNALPQQIPTQIQQEAPQNWHSENTIPQPFPEEFNNISSSNSAACFYDAEFEDMYFGCRLSNKQVGKKHEIYQEYQKHKNISCKNMRFAYLFYLNDKKAYKENRAFGLVKFMQNQVYLNYLNIRVQIKLDGKEIKGIYKREDNKLICDDKNFYTLTNERFLELLQQDRVKLLEKAA
ncbi:MAG: hypothetical protein LBP40_04750 [Campylobacteraceae bacterium]|jgi:hypothetical protein|nr:hypothetical protein [Campylobacteraceae bacterium]